VGFHGSYADLIVREGLVKGIGLKIWNLAVTDDGPFFVKDGFGKDETHAIFRQDKTQAIDLEEYCPVIPVQPKQFRTYGEKLLNTCGRNLSLRGFAVENRKIAIAHTELTELGSDKKWHTVNLSQFRNAEDANRFLEADNMSIHRLILATTLCFGVSNVL
jgi:hypothetical protein